jgi:hypothetical protein
VFENEVLRRIFRPKWDEVTGGWKNCITRSFKICTTLHQMLLDRMKSDEMDGECSTRGVMINAYKILVGKSNGKRPHGRLRCRWEDIIKTDLKEIG